jgi:hypothetical protein
VGSGDKRGGGGAGEIEVDVVPHWGGMISRRREGWRERGGGGGGGYRYRVGKKR